MEHFIPANYRHPPQPSSSSSSLTAPTYSPFSLSTAPSLQAQRKADALGQSLSALGDTVKAQTAPNKDVQKEIADMTEVWPGCCYT